MSNTITPHPDQLSQHYTDWWTNFIAEKKADHVVLSKAEFNALLADKHLLDRMEEIFKVTHPLSTENYRAYLSRILWELP